MKRFSTTTAEETRQLGTHLGTLIDSRLAVSLDGDLGSGKTTFVQGLARGMGVDENYYITSPTFNIINEYPAQSGLKLCHMDLYRLGSAEELETIGFNDLVGEQCLIIVEWPDLLKGDGFLFDLGIRFTIDAEFTHHLDFEALSAQGKKILSRIKHKG